MSSSDYLDFILKQSNKISLKRKLEGEELQYFLFKSSKRLNRMRSGERLVDVIRKPPPLAIDTRPIPTDNISNSKIHNDTSLDVIQSVLEKQYDSKSKEFDFEKQIILPILRDENKAQTKLGNSIEYELVESFKSMDNLYNYMTGNTFDPRQEFFKEKDIENFFKLKYKLISEYLCNALPL